MIQKRILCPNLVRSVPKQFGWVDHKLLKDRHFSRCSCAAMKLYLFLLIVGDAQGLSYYSDDSIVEQTRISKDSLMRARKELIEARLLAYSKPLYQVLSLSLKADSRRPTSKLLPAKEILRKALGE